jgi:aminoglycoside phosphotransferase (APT) family kinase protein
VLVRKIGKTACSLSGTDARRLMVRIPRSNIALRRAQRNHLALERLHGAEDRWQGLRPLIPGPVAAGRAGDYAYFAETVVPGRPREMRVNALVWEPQALDAIVGMHRASRAAACVDEEVFSQHLGLALDEITAALADPVEHATLDRLRARLWTDLRERQLPMVSAHGDFTGENCLYDDRGRLSGIIDWELFKPAGFPVLDLLQCMDIPGEADSRESWLRCELVFDAVQRRGAVHDSPVLHRYVDELGVPSGLLPALLLAYWVDHVGARIAARGTDRAWMNKRVHGPLRRLARLL